MATLPTVFCTLATFRKLHVKLGLAGTTAWYICTATELPPTDSEQVLLDNTWRCAFTVTSDKYAVTKFQKHGTPKYIDQHSASQ